MKQERLQAAYIGGPTALFEWHGFRLLTDPTFDPPGGKYQNGPVVLEKTIGPALAPEALGRVDLLSHDHHLDNLDHSRRTFLASVPRVITTPEGAERLVEILSASLPGRVSTSRAAMEECFGLPGLPRSTGRPIFNAGR